MNEENVMNPENDVNKEQAEKPETKKEATKPVKEKKDNWFKRTGRKIKEKMSEHPFLTAFGGAAIGSAATVGVAEVGKRVINSRSEKQVTYIQEDPNSLDPNV